MNVDINSDAYKILEDNVRTTFASVVWTHKIQEKQTDIIWMRFKILESIKILCATLTSVGIIALLFKDVFWVKIVSALLSFATLFISTLYKSFDLRSMVSAHKDTANALLNIRNNLQFLLMEIRLERRSVEELTQDYAKICKELETVYAKAPVTSDGAVTKARTALYSANDNSYSDEEIDHLLPKTLWTKEKNDGE